MDGQIDARLEYSKIIAPKFALKTYVEGLGTSVNIKICSHVQDKICHQMYWCSYVYGSVGA